jgi:hypothetical protein
MKKSYPPGVIMIELDDRHIPVSIHVNEKERQTFAVSFSEVGDAVHDAASIFGLLFDVIARAKEVPSGVPAMLSICHKHFSQLADKQAQDVLDMSSRFRCEAHQAEKVRKEGLE